MLHFFLPLVPPYISAQFIRVPKFSTTAAGACPVTFTFVSTFSVPRILPGAFSAGAFIPARSPYSFRGHLSLSPIALSSLSRSRSRIQQSTTRPRFYFSYCPPVSRPFPPDLSIAPRSIRSAGFFTASFPSPRSFAPTKIQDFSPADVGCTFSLACPPVQFPFPAAPALTDGIIITFSPPTRNETREGRFNYFIA